ncbi:hypothetical protein CBS115989_2977 [Aspergillus niger]|uniref:Contig An01c0050, genomic contig n=3 Tax=Aspergillus niger TaxID=5061 RepID=A2Q7L4_ASPNC|nr:uncharacterized protein An01g01140 [Aspergillus niger]RDH19785.1 hypothetical protein M747DRAFT_296216 [Aspergillus niger ATCC 13496]KAI2821223.1 hypothetical protein CBS115989_2977 [Aspergillus niger]KAI2857293.1 hypothetical protein CBS11232_3369 [Aspergillus niger]KAI2868310.1 hypothetical protein CBS115988_10788 [Aspergillus niger]KAI2889285.1 hypothetical protein CBS11852_6815 [Aspergillus niger]|eukprot:XP_001388556.1 hypothetical protein ANI_1_2200014 [Aspergillus niger CBS 513.88]
MTWSQVSAHRWERPGDGLENYFALTASLSAAAYDGRRHYTIFTKLQLELDMPATEVECSLKKAWVQLRYEQPQIATVHNGTTKVYEVPDDTALQAWIASTVIISAAANAEDLYASITPIAQATLYYLPASSQLVLRTPHDTIDGIGVIRLLDRLLSILVSPPAEKITFGDEPSRLAPTLREILGVAEQPTPEESDRMMALWKPYIDHAPGIGPVSNLGNRPAGQSQHARLDVPTRTTEAIIQACKAKNITVTSAVHAAYIETIKKHADPDHPSCHYVNTAQFNLRPYLPKHGSQYTASLGYTLFPVHLESPSSFGPTAQALNQFYRTTFADDPSKLPLVPHMTDLLFAVTQNPEYQKGPFPRDAIPSSLGIIENHMRRSYGTNKVIVRDFMLGVDVVMGMNMLSISTFRDQLQLVYSFNDAYHEPEHISQYLQEIVTVLTKELLAN